MLLRSLLLGWALLVLVPSAELADPFDDAVVEDDTTTPARDAAAAEMLFQKGRDAMAESDFDAACQFFIESLALDAAVGTVMNLAVCEEERGRYTASWERWHQALRLLSPDDDRVIFADQKLDAVAQKLAYLTVRLPPGAPQGLTVRRDGIPLGSGSLGEELPADPGDHVVTVESPNYETRTFSISLESGDHETLVVMQGNQKKKPRAKSNDNVQARRVGGYAALGVGAGGAILAVVSAVLLPAQDQKVEDNCPNKQCNETGDKAVAEARTLLALNTAGIVVAGVGAVTGTVLLLTLPKKPSATDPQRERAQRRPADKEQRSALLFPLALGWSATGLNLQGQF
ncbi:MAG TPA: hypothetical protein VN764_03215 [Polyangiaceae bacterium]|nr:hypothetical protein [Polyangiaceae bacterium]